MDPANDMVYDLVSTIRRLVCQAVKDEVSAQEGAQA